MHPTRQPGRRPVCLTAPVLPCWGPHEATVQGSPPGYCPPLRLPVLCVPPFRSILSYHLPKLGQLQELQHQLPSGGTPGAQVTVSGFVQIMVLWGVVPARALLRRSTPEMLGGLPERAGQLPGRVGHGQAHPGPRCHPAARPAMQLRARPQPKLALGVRLRKTSWALFSLLVNTYDHGMRYAWARTCNIDRQN